MNASRVSSTAGNSRWPAATRLAAATTASCTLAASLALPVLFTRDPGFCGR